MSTLKAEVSQDLTIPGRGNFNVPKTAVLVARDGSGTRDELE